MDYGLCRVVVRVVDVVGVVIDGFALGDLCIWSMEYGLWIMYRPRGPWIGTNGMSERVAHTTRQNSCAYFMEGALKVAIGH